MRPTFGHHTANSSTSSTSSTGSNPGKMRSFLNFLSSHTPHSSTESATPSHKPKRHLLRRHRRTDSAVSLPPISLVLEPETLGFVATAPPSPTSTIRPTYPTPPPTAASGTASLEDDLRALRIACEQLNHLDLDRDSTRQPRSDTADSMAQRDAEREREVWEIFYMI
jgi:hypothetical protein